MNNAVFHKSEQTKILIDDAKCELLFFLPYSPDMSPIKKFWANLKDKLKKVIGKFNSLTQAVDYAFQSIT